jgi:hypothetical protein
MAKSLLETKMDTVEPSGDAHWTVPAAAVEVLSEKIAGVTLGTSDAAASPGSDASKAIAVQGVTNGKNVPVSAAQLETSNASLEAIQISVAKTIPATTAVAVTPSDSTALTSRAVWIGGAGNLSVRLSGATSTTVVFTNIPDGSLLPLSVVRIMAATTATNIVVLA